MKFLFICLFLFCIPTFSHAAIVINEIAWMGTSVSANDEWIELYNNGSQSIDVDGWQMTDGVDLNIELTGTIGAGEFVVFERTDDASAPGTAFLIYTGSLTNTGATLSLYRDDDSLYRDNDSLEDSVAGGADWGAVGGDNITKETAQYTPNGWVTAVATPGSSNNGSTVPDDEEEEENEDEESDADDHDDSSSSKRQSSVTGTLYTTPRELQLELNIPERMYVHQEVSMSVDANGVSSPILNSLTHEWNFGDFNVSIGEEVEHRFKYPGEYVVTLHSTYKEYEAYARKTVIVLPVSFSLTTSPKGDVQVHNNSKYEVDVSGYKIQAGKTLRFPEGTILLPKATITIPKAKLGYTRGMSVTLKDEMKTVVASLGLTPAVRSVTVETPKPVVLNTYVAKPPKKVAVNVSVPTPSKNFGFAGDESLKETSTSTKEVGPRDSDTTPPLENALLAAPIQATGSIPSEKLPYLALLSVIGLGVLAVFAGQAKK